MEIYSIAMWNDSQSQWNNSIFILINILFLIIINYFYFLFNLSFLHVIINYYFFVKLHFLNYVYINFLKNLKIMGKIGENLPKNFDGKNGKMMVEL